MCLTLTAQAFLREVETRRYSDGLINRATSSLFCLYYAVQRGIDEEGCVVDLLLVAEFAQKQHDGCIVRVGNDRAWRN
jgi:hypothetical protein